MKIDGIMRKFGYISEKAFTEVAVEIYNKNDTDNAKDEKDFYYRSGNANAIGYICGRLGIDITRIIRGMRGEQDEN